MGGEGSIFGAIKSQFFRERFLAHPWMKCVKTFFGCFSFNCYGEMKFLYFITHTCSFLGGFSSLVTVPIALYKKGRKNFENISRLAHVSVLDIEVKNGFKSFFQRDLLERKPIFWGFKYYISPFMAY